MRVRSTKKHLPSWKCVICYLPPIKAKYASLIYDSALQHFKAETTWHLPLLVPCYNFWLTSHLTYIYLCLRFIIKKKCNYMHICGKLYWKRQVHSSLTRSLSVFQMSTSYMKYTTRLIQQKSIDIICTDPYVDQAVEHDTNRLFKTLFTYWIARVTGRTLCLLIQAYIILDTPIMCRWKTR